MEKKASTEAAAPEAGDAPRKAPRKRRKSRRWGFAAFFSLAVACLVFFVLSLSLSGRTMPVPDMLRAKLEDALNARIEGAPLRLGAMELGIDRRGVPQLLMNDLQIADRTGGAVAQLNWLGAELSIERIMRREFAAEKIFLTGAQITIRRTAAGRFTLSAGPGLSGGEQTVADVLALVDAAMTDGAFSSLSEVVAAGVVITLEDARSGRIWQATNASAMLRQTETGLSLSVTSDVFNGTDNLAGLQVSLIRSRATEHVQLGVLVEAMPAADIALQSPVLSWLGVLDAPISGAVRTELDETGTLQSFAGTLDIAGGALQPAMNTPPVAFEAAKAYFTFDPGRQRLDFSEISFRSEDATGVATGHTYLRELDGVWPTSYLSQFRLENLSYSGGGALDGPVTLDDIRADFRVRLNPFTVDLGQVYIDNQGVPVSASGRISGDDAGWHVAVDATTPEISADRVLAFWPEAVAPMTNGWLTRNLTQGQLRDAAAGFRFDSGSKPELALSFNFENGLVRFLPDMPRLANASGRAELHAHRFSLALETGEIAGPEGQVIDLSGSAFTVPDTRPKPSRGEIDVRAAGRLDAVLGVLNNAPLRLMDRAKRPVDLAKADISGTARVTLPLKGGIAAEEVGFDVAADLGDVASDLLVPGRVFTSPALRLGATPEAVTLSGPARLDGIPLSANWRQPLGAAAAEGGEITGEITLSPATVAAFDLPLPEGLFSGQGRASYSLRLPADPALPPRLRLTSDLKGLAMGLDALGWRKPREEAGELSLTARLGPVPDVESFRIATRDLSFDGALELSDDGRLERARLTGLELGRWLDAEVEVTPSAGGGSPTISVLGGTMDLRQLERGSVGGGAGGGAGPINLRLDRLVISDGIALAPFRGRVAPGATGLSGNFEARLNGGTAIQGTLTPANAGTAIRISSPDAAGVLRDAGLTPNTREGALDLVLTPVPDAPRGTFDGQFLIEDIRLRDAPAMAELLDAVSVVGLLDQLSGSGIRFDTVDGQFRMTPRQITLRQAAAVGPSIGISADGLYDLNARQMDFQGVVSPVYFLNGIGSFLTRRGEGLFGFNYRMAGPAGDPSVRVNPLSILTPGAFRQIFRQAPPGG